MKKLALVLARLPSDGMGAETPMPRNERKLSVKMAEGICSVVVTMSVPMQFVRMCFLMMRPVPAPRARAAVTYSLSFSVSTWLRTMRAIPTQYKRANTIRILMSCTPMMLIQPKPGFSARDCSGYFSVEASRMMMSRSGTV